MNRQRLCAIAGLGVVLGATMAWWFARSSAPAGPTVPGAAATAAPKNTATVGPTTPRSQRVAALLDGIRARLAGSRNSETSRLILAELRSLLDSLPPADASKAVQVFLASNLDAATKLDVTIRAGGGLGDASSLRVFLLDYLGKIDLPAAGVIAAQILSRETAPDEWAVSLRNYAWANPGPAGIAFLQDKSRQLLGNATWVIDPSVGYLEAFDTIVYTHGTALVPELAALVRSRENRATAHAAYLTLDRLTLVEPVAMLQQLVDRPDLMRGREQSRANLFARADVRDARQRALVEQYLLDPTRKSEELATFAGLYPNANYMISHNLLTTVATPTGVHLRAHDREAIKTIEQWREDPRFLQLMPLLTEIHERLRSYLR